MPMTRLQLVEAIDIPAVEAAIAEAERVTSGEIRVSVAPFFWGNVHKVADRAFDRLGMRNTRDHNGVLIFIVPSRRKFVVLGDSGIHAKVGQETWDRVAKVLGQHFAREEFTAGLVDAIHTLGAELARYFPHAGTQDLNELSDAVDLAPDL